LYLARIGQFQPLDAIKANEIYWTDKRLSEEAVNAAGEAIDQAKRLVKASKIHLIGYSGGGGLAALLAERRFDVASLVTVAGLLDTDYWVLNHGWRPLIGSLNPIKNAKNTAFIPQIHFYGSKDYIIDSSLSLRFEQASQFANFKRLSQDADHYSGWTPKWPSLLTQYVVPLRRPSFSPPATIDLGSSLSLRP
jgi:pimeloyl-ACP methyl ester carboxylesterase